MRVVEMNLAKLGNRMSVGGGQQPVKTDGDLSQCIGNFPLN